MAALLLVLWLLLKNGAATENSHIEGALLDFQVVEGDGVSLLQDVVNRVDVDPIGGAIFKSRGPHGEREWRRLQPIDPARPFPFLQLAPGTDLFITQGKKKLSDLDQWTIFFQGTAGPPTSPTDQTEGFTILLSPGEMSCQFCHVRYEAGNKLGLFFHDVLWTKPLPYPIYEPHTLTLSKSKRLLKVYQNGELVDSFGFQGGSFSLFTARLKAWYATQGHLRRPFVHRLLVVDHAIVPKQNGDIAESPPTHKPTHAPVRSPTDPPTVFDGTHKPTHAPTPWPRDANGKKKSWIARKWTKYAFACVALAVVEFVVFLNFLLRNPFRSDAVFFTTLLLASSIFDNVVVGVGDLIGPGDTLTALSYVRLFAYRGFVSFFIVVCMRLVRNTGIFGSRGRSVMLAAYLASILIYEGFMPSPGPVALKQVRFMGTLRLEPVNHVALNIEYSLVCIIALIAYSVLWHKAGEATPFLGALVALVVSFIPSSVGGPLLRSLGTALILFGSLTSRYLVNMVRTRAQEELPLLG